MVGKTEGAAKPAADRSEARRSWTFLTNHAHVLLAVTRNPDLRVSELAKTVGISERYAYRVLNDLEVAGFVDRDRNGRCNVYRIDIDMSVGDPVLDERFVNELLQLIGLSDSAESARSAA